MSNARRDLGTWGEQIAAAWLERHGARVLERNRRSGRGEVDLIVSIGGRRALVEVRTVHGHIDFERLFPVAKRRQLRRLAAEVGLGRIDLVAVAVLSDRVDLHWLRNVPTD
ncbi:MAG: YraN family protein [Acidimicrobiia bacterium]|nr:YraN family protein [Acidimicrobiia bacterium]